LYRPSMVATRSVLTRLNGLATPGLGRVARVLPGGKFECPGCGHAGHFGPMVGSLAVRRRARCPHCGILERHRLQLFAWGSVASQLELSGKRVLHLAPDPAVGEPLRRWAASYVTADIDPRGVDMALDLRDMPSVADSSFDLVWASHVMEHIDDDMAALQEVHRVLAVGGAAVLPVPIVADRTVEYPAPSIHEELHMRAPGLDYFDKYKRVFDRVEVVTSDDAPESIQPWVYERRTRFPNWKAPLRPAQRGRRHLDAVPICWKL